VRWVPSSGVSVPRRTPACCLVGEVVCPDFRTAFTRLVVVPREDPRTRDPAVRRARGSAPISTGFDAGVVVARSRSARIAASTSDDIHHRRRPPGSRNGVGHRPSAIRCRSHVSLHGIRCRTSVAATRRMPLGVVVVSVMVR
jgi:hypothetical protein